MIGRVLVIKLGALGDFILALGPFAAIRKAHKDAEITLLTTAPFADLARASGWFDAVWVDDRPSLLALWRWCTLRRRLRAGRFDRVYDLQTSDRSDWYFRLLGPGGRPEWCGRVRGCSHRHANPRRDFMHTADRQSDQLAVAGIREVPPPDLSWVKADVSRFGLTGRYALIVPGGAAHRPGKRWPATRYTELAASLAARGLTPVVVGARQEAPIAAEIAADCAAARSLCGETTIAEIAALARGAAGAVGNDTGPMHVIAAAGCPVLVLYSDDSDPALTRPVGPEVAILRRPRLADLPVAEVAAALRLR
jgi:ADP-heptose:LPS heptosyltransferase